MLTACSSNSNGGGPSDAATGDAADAADPCSPGPGQVPLPNCNNEPHCDTTVQPCMASSPCLALADNSGKSVVDLRIRKLRVTTPSSLSVQFVQDNLVDKGVNLTETCEGGDGGFSVLLRLDTAAKTLTAGGGPPQMSSSPTCFVNTTNNGFAVAPVTSPASQATDGTWQASAFSGTLNIPVFADGQLTELVTLPLRNASIQSMQLSSPDNNCVGTYSAVADCKRWTPAATLSGFITLEDADRVPIPQLSGSTLCVLLTDQTSLTCPRDANGKIIATGNYCSTSNGPATSTCADSFWLASTFAASAVTIGDGAGVPLCQGAADAAAE
jgi:hypothetical protein